MVHFNLLYLQHENGKFPDKGYDSKSYLLSPRYKPWKFVIGIFEHSVYMRKVTRSYRSYSSLVKLQPWLLSLRWKTCHRQNCTHGSLRLK